MSGSNASAANNPAGTDGGGSGGDLHKQRYIFGNRGVVRDLIYPNKAILYFKLGGRDEKAILLAKSLTLDGRAPEEGRQLSEYLRVGDEILFDCHVYDKGGAVGTGKDRCNYFAIKATKNSREFEAKTGGTAGGTAGAAAGQGVVGARKDLLQGTGWVSELNPRKGVLTFEHNGKDERVLFLASKVWCFEKRLGARQPLMDVLSEGDPVQFEAVAQDPAVEEQQQQQGGPSAAYHCPWFAHMVWKGKRPAGADVMFSMTPGDHGSSGSLSSTNDPARTSSPASMRRSSLGSENSLSESYGGDDTNGSNGYSNYGGIVNGRVNDGVIKGVGMIGKILNDKTGIVWWLKSANHLQSVWFEARQTFVYGTNLADKNLLDIFKEGDPVTFIAEKPPDNFPTKWIAKQVLINDQTASIVTKAVDRSGYSTGSATVEALPE